MCQAFDGETASFGEESKPLPASHELALFKKMLWLAAALLGAFLEQTLCPSALRMCHVVLRLGSLPNVDYEGPFSTSAAGLLT